MNTVSIPTPRFATLLAAASVAAAAGQAMAVDKSWNAAAGGWSTANNWFLPGVPAATDNVFIGSTIAAQNAIVDLSANTTVAALTITDGMYVRTNSNKLTVAGAALFSGYNTDGIFGYSSGVGVEQGAAAIDFDAGSLRISDGARLRMMDGAVARVNGLLRIDDSAAVYGHGTVQLNAPAGTGLILDGALQPGIEGLTVTQMGAGRMDLDGSVAGEYEGFNITLRMSDGSGFAHLTLNGDQPADPFNDNIFICTRNVLNMNFTNGWEMGAGSRIEVYDGDHGGAAEINGGHLTFSGDIGYVGTPAYLQFNGPVELTPSATATLGVGDTLEFNAATTISGGHYTAGEDSHGYFQGATTVNGGTFTTESIAPQDGSFTFNGATTWDGNVTIDGNIRQVGGATVSGPTVITGGAIDMDGVGTTAWDINSSLTLNVDYIDTVANNVFNGTITIDGGASPRMGVNLSNPDAVWFAAGVLNLSGNGLTVTTRITGSEMHVTGTLNVAGLPRIDADTELSPGSTTNLPNILAQLNLGGRSLVRPGAVLNGTGSLTCVNGGELTLEDAVSTGGVGITNAGVFRVDESAGYAVADRVTFNASGRWDVQIGGEIAGAEHDHLTLTGASGAHLGGQLRVALIDLGGGLFIPHEGDSFTILNARNGVVGTFTNSPVTLTGNLIIRWTVQYNASDVTLVVSDILPRCPADFNGDGFVDFFDFDAFVDCFENNVCPPGLTADVNNDGFVDFFDFDAFIDAFEAGC